MATWSRVSLALSATALTLAAGCTKPPPPPPEAPQVLSFSADKTRVSPGDAVTLSFATKNATAVEVVDDSGAAIQLEGEVAQGTAKVAPGRSTVYVLRATGPGGRDSAFAQVAVDEPPRTVFLLAVPSVVDAGQPAQLAWSAFGARAVTLKSSLGDTQTLTGESGTVDVTPARSAVYTLTGDLGAGRPALSATTRVQVRPVVLEVKATPRAVHAGDTLTVAWKTAGADVVQVSEAQFGLLAKKTAAADVAQGTFDFVVPAKLPNGIDVLPGLPLRFEVAASVADLPGSVTRTVDARVGDGPAVVTASAPTFASLGKSFDLAWTTQRASRVTVLVGGQPIFETLPADAARVANGRLTLPTPSANTDYVVRASDDAGLTAEKTVTVKPVALPVIDSFTLPGSVAQAGDAALAKWTTRNASRLHLRLAGGANLATITTAAQVASGQASLLPGTTGAITLEAWNQAGDVVTSTKAITVTTAAASVTPTPALTGQTVTLSWSFPNGGVTEVVGLPNGAPVATSQATTFQDLTNAPTARVLTFTDANEGYALLDDVRSFRFPLMGELHEAFFASVNGVLTFSAPGAGTLDNVSLAADGGVAPQTLVAPFWDDLQTVAASQVLYDVQDTASGDRRLVVQWNHLEAVADPGSDLTFQVQLTEAGRVSFVYGKLLGAAAPSGTSVALGGSATIALAVPSQGLVEHFSSNGGVPLAEALDLAFLQGHPVTGSTTFTAQRASVYTLTGLTPTNTVPARVELRAFGPGDVLVSEAMPQPEASVSGTGQWIELTNRLPLTVDLGGLLLKTSDSQDGGFLLPSPTWVDAGAQFVVGQSLDSALTGGARVDLVGEDLPLALDGGTASLELGGVTLSSLSWGASVEKQSVVSAPRVLLASGSTFSCSRTATYGTQGALGTPGAPNEPCGAYAVQSIPGGFVDASGGTRLVFFDADDDYLNLTLPAPFRYFGQSVTTVGISTNGFLALGQTLTSSSYSNPSTPSTTTPNAVVAPFWDDLMDNGAGEAWMLRQPGRTIYSWQDYGFSVCSSSASMYFQVHLLDTGVIELHYGAMTDTGAPTTCVTGSSASTWLESPDGSLALPINVNTAGGIVPNSGYRFTPTP